MSLHFTKIHIVTNFFLTRVIFNFPSKETGRKFPLLHTKWQTHGQDSLLIRTMDRKISQCLMVGLGMANILLLQQPTLITSSTSFTRSLIMKQISLNLKARISFLANAMMSKQSCYHAVICACSLTSKCHPLQLLLIHELGEKSITTCG